ncbi:MAG TPA: thiamine-phosphate kinase [Elusimicrobiales bacterium]|nr:thiamine-phosphate kinase [Elusimicrobiales bacterium]
MKKRMPGEVSVLADIAKIFRFPADRRLLLGPGDDCAVLRHSPARELVITTDELVEGTHYLARFAAPEDLARKLMRVNLSDLAAMGAVRPVACVVGAGLRRDTAPDFVRRFIRELKKEALRFKLSVAGGNLAGARENHFYMTVWGEAAMGELVLRRGAAPGDLLLNIGALGEAAAGLEILKAGKAAEIKKYSGLVRSFWQPRPMLEAGRLISRHKLATAMMDNSDGLLSSARDLARAGRARVILSPGEGACSPELRGYSAGKKKDWRGYAISGGEDYGLIFSARPDKLSRIKKSLPGVAVVGRFEAGCGVEIENFDGKVKSFGHF